MAGTKEATNFTIEEAHEANVSPVENLPNPERPRLRLTKTIALTGPESSGKGEVLRILQERHGWKVFDGTQIGFKRKGSGPEKGHIKRSKKQHKAMDRRQARIFKNLKLESEHLIVEAKLAGIIKAEQEDIIDNQIDRISELNRPRIQEGREEEDLIKTPDPIPAVTILLWATQEVRVKRAYEDANAKYVAHLEKYLEQSQLIMDGVNIPEDELVPDPPDHPPTKEGIEKLMKERQYQDTVDWESNHPNYVKKGENPYSRYLKRPKNRGLVYDRWIDTSNLTPEEVADKFEKFALKMGAAEPLSFAELEAIERETKKDDKSDSIPKNIEIFNSEKTGEKDAKKTNKKVKTNGKSNPQIKNEFKTENGKSVGEPISRMPKFPDKHPNPHHPSRKRKNKSKSKA